MLITCVVMVQVMVRPATNPHAVTGPVTVAGMMLMTFFTLDRSVTVTASASVFRH